MTRLTFNGTAIRYGKNVLSMPPIYNDWFLPTQAALATMRVELHDYGLGNFTNGYYWASNEGSPSNGTTISIFGGSGTSLPKGDIYNVRPIRKFTANNGTYNLRDTGPGGGLIFYILGTLHLESYTQDLDDSVWSNITNQSVGTTSTDIDDGDSNTQTIINQPGHITSAALLCTQLVTHGSI